VASSEPLVLRGFCMVLSLAVAITQDYKLAMWVSMFDPVSMIVPIMVYRAEPLLVGIFIHSVITCKLNLLDQFECCTPVHV